MPFWGVLKADLVVFTLFLAIFTFFGQFYVLSMAVALLRGRTESGRHALTWFRHPKVPSSSLKPPEFTFLLGREKIFPPRISKRLIPSPYMYPGSEISPPRISIWKNGWGRPVFPN